MYRKRIHRNSFEEFDHDELNGAFYYNEVANAKDDGEEEETKGDMDVGE